MAKRKRREAFNPKPPKVRRLPGTTRATFKGGVRNLLGFASNAATKVKRLVPQLHNSPGVYTNAEGRQVDPRTDEVL